MDFVIKRFFLLLLIDLLEWDVERNLGWVKLKFTSQRPSWSAHDTLVREHRRAHRRSDNRNIGLAIQLLQSLLFKMPCVPGFDLLLCNFLKVAASQFLVGVGYAQDSHDRDVGQKEHANEGKQEPSHFDATIHVRDPLGEGKERVAGQENRYFVQDLLQVHVRAVVWFHISYVAHREQGGEELPEDLRVARRRGQGQQQNHEVSADEEDHDVGLRVLVILEVFEELRIGRAERWVLLSILFRFFGQILSVATGIDN